MQEVTLRGKIERIWEGKGISVITLFLTSRNGRANFPEVSFIRKDRTMLEGIKEKDFVEIKGELVTRGKGESYSEQREYVQFIRAVSIKKIKNELTERFGKELQGRYQFKDEVYMEGDIEYLIKGKRDFVSFLIRPDGKKYNLIGTLYTTNPDVVAERYPKGAHVCLRGEIQTRKTTQDGKPKFFENLIIREIAKDASVQQEAAIS